MGDLFSRSVAATCRFRWRKSFLMLGHPRFTQNIVRTYGCVSVVSCSMWSLCWRMRSCTASRFLTVLVFLGAGNCSLDNIGFHVYHGMFVSDKTHVSYVRCWKCKCWCVGKQAQWTFKSCLHLSLGTLNAIKIMDLVSVHFRCYGGTAWANGM